VTEGHSIGRFVVSLGRAAGLGVLVALVLGLGCWGAPLLFFAGPGNAAARIAAASWFGALAVATLIAIFVRRWRWPVTATFTLSCAALLVLWANLDPRGDRDWQPSVAVLAYATIAGDYATLHNIRNFDYRSEDDYTVAYYDKTFDMRKLQSVDMVTSYWMGPAIAHVFISFGFSDDDYLAVSVEVRKPRGRAYSTLAGFFRQYEMIYVVADERDVIRLRTNYRENPPENVYLYRAKASPEAARRLFVEYLERINALRTQPEFYNTLTSNCTTIIWMNDHVNPGRVPLDWKIVVSGYVPDYLYDQGRLEDMGLPFSELKSRSYINARARAADAAVDFSRRIRSWSLDAGG
jgi:hypothetical protein